MRFDFYSSRWSQLTDILFVAAVASLASCTSLADPRETNRGESVFVALAEN